MLHHARVEDRGLLIVRCSSAAERFDGINRFPLLEDVDSPRFELVGRDVEVDAPARGTCCADEFGTTGEVLLAVVGLDLEEPGNDDHRSFLASSSRRPGHRRQTAPCRESARRSLKFATRPAV